MSNKLEVIKNQPELFKSFKEALGRGKWLSASVILCADCIEVFLLPPDQSSTDMTEYTCFIGYTEESLTSINALLDGRAQALKNRWAPHFRVLNESADCNWSIDISKQDYAVLAVGNLEDLHRYRLTWSYDGLLEAADYLSRRSNTVLDEED
jgi:hypothetical protein